MKRAAGKILLPCLIFAIAEIILISLLWSNFAAEYRTQSNADVAIIIGAVIEKYPEIDPADIITVFRHHADGETLIAGEKVLRQYGLLADDYATTGIASLEQKYLHATLFVVLATIVIFCLYLAWIYYRQSRSIHRLVAYLRDIGNRIYDLHPDDNDEGEFSLLANELYKTAVVLKEAAELNREHSLKLSNALADISHQLRTPLTSIQVMVDNISDDPDMPPDIRQDFLLSISRQVATMSQNVTTLLHLAQFDNGSIKLQPQKLKIGELLHSSTEQLAVLAELSVVELEITGDLDATVCLDAHWQREALTNIIKNCIEYSPRRSTVKVRAQKCPLYLRITIQDQGPGMTAKVQHRIFERFYKAPGSTSDGIGIGLAFARVIVEAEDGQISVSSAPGHGTTFSVTYFL